VIFKDSDSNIELSKNGITGEDYYYEMFKNSPLKELYLGRPIDKFSYGTFMNLPSLTDLTISEKVTSIATNLFKDDTGLKKVILPNSVTHIYDNAFNGCVSLSEISIPSQLTWIGEGAFENCIALANIEIPTSIYGIGLRAFFNCSSLTSISIGNNVNSIEVATFSGCSSLQIVSLGEKVTYIGNNAFDRCKMVKKFYSWNPTPPSAGSESLSGINRSECTLYVPKGSGDIYWLHPEWGQFFDIKEIETSDINAISKYDIQSSYFNLDGKRTNNTRKGINIIKMNNEAIKKVFIK
ncbi:MAG: leucine-rich repeat domain-containing protein, partial [Prevotella sp.]|nr:leucine-rich repeat domain-containing protein [Prevotella sp.]